MDIRGTQKDEEKDVERWEWKMGIKKKKLPVSPTKPTSSDTQISSPFKSMSSTLKMQFAVF